MVQGPGSKIGSYTVTGKLGEGGMGTVYRANDSRLKRDVAIKVLPEAFTEDPDRLARFEREAQVLAQLHHPNIASIFGIEESDGIRALVMELVEGPTLAERMAERRIPIEDALGIAVHIAEALEEAHANHTRMGTPEKLFSVAMGNPFFSAGPDRERFLILVDPDAEHQTLGVLLNWRARLD